MRTAPNARQNGLPRNGQAVPAAKSAAPSGGPDQLVHRDAGGHQPGVADAQVAFRTTIGSGVPEVVSTKTSAVPAGTGSRGRRRHRPAPVTTARRQGGEESGPEQVDGGHEPPAVDPVGEERRRTGRTAATAGAGGDRPARRPEGRTSARRRSADRRRARSRRRGCRPRTSRPASGTDGPSAPGARLPRRGSRDGDLTERRRPGRPHFPARVRGGGGPAPPTGDRTPGSAGGRLPSTSSASSASGSSPASGYGVPLTLQTTSSSSSSSDRVNAYTCSCSGSTIVKSPSATTGSVVPQRDQPPVVGEHRRRVVALGAGVPLAVVGVHRQPRRPHGEAGVLGVVPLHRRAGVVPAHPAHRGQHRGRVLARDHRRRRSG